MLKERPEQVANLRDNNAPWTKPGTSLDVLAVVAVRRVIRAHFKDG